MKTEMLTGEEQNYLLNLARHSIRAAIRKENLPIIEVNKLSINLTRNGASFVTLTQSGNLRGCIGSLEPYQPLVYDVQEHAIAAALEDFRFDQVTENELESIEIEISILTEPIPIKYNLPSDLLKLLHPNVDGVILKDGIHRATFLPQVWEQLPNPGDFLSHLCNKMGRSPTLWKEKKLEVEIYQVQKFHEKNIQ